MKLFAHKVKAFYSNLRIKYKMFVLISIVMLVVSIISLFVQQFAFDVYDKEIYKQSANSLHLSSSGIENELKKMERLSYRVVTDPEIQNYLISLNRGDLQYDRFVAIDKLNERLLDLGGLDKYILSLQLFDGQGEEYAAGAKITRTPDERKQKIKREAAEKTGGISWISPDADDHALVIGREIRAVPNLDLNHLGTLA
jgi:two-component system sensor histidine kinase YesM